MQDDSGQVVYASQPPPPLPEYSQPPTPGQNYEWTRAIELCGCRLLLGPRTWVLAPYTNALWTPPYRGFESGRYRWHRGYWGRHIGYYRGINYGFGDTGHGYYGGYSKGGSFAYNRAVTTLSIPCAS